VVLFLQGRAPSQMLLTGSLDFVLGILFVAAFIVTRKQTAAQSASSNPSAVHANA